MFARHVGWLCFLVFFSLFDVLKYIEMLFWGVQAPFLTFVV